MVSKITTVVLLFLATAIAVPSSSLVYKRHAHPQGGPPNDECRPRPPPQGMEVSECCPIPQLFKGSEDIIEACIKEVGENPALARPPPPGGDDGNRPPPPPDGKPAGPHVHVPCIDECVFNKTGLVSDDRKINKDNLKKKVGDLTNGDDAWSTIGQSALDKCTDKPPRGEEPSMKVCPSGAFEFKGCFERELFLNCPADKWVDS